MNLDLLRLLTIALVALSAFVAVGAARWPGLIRWGGIPCGLGLLLVLVAGWLAQ